MKTLFFAIALLLGTASMKAQSIYSKAYGHPDGEPLIFLHGGPGYNSVNFEVTTAERLADEGFYVIVYDRRGEGRSPDKEAKYTFEQSYEDLAALYRQYGLEKASLIGHSFGGMLATLFAEKYPSRVKSIILVGAPVDLQETFQTIIAQSKAIYESKQDSVNLNYISMLENMDKSSLPYSSYCFMHAMQNGFYTPKNSSAEAKELYAALKSDSEAMKHAAKMSYQAPQGFWKNESYTTLDLAPNLKALKQGGARIYALYGKEDGLYAAQQVADLEAIVGEEQLKYWDNCSHSVFIDQQTAFIKALKDWLQ